MKNRRQRIRKVETKEVIENGILVLYKKCTACLEFKKLEEFHNSKKETLGKRSYCRSCESLRRKNKLNVPFTVMEEVIDGNAVKVKLCTKCKIKKPLDQFYDDSGDTTSGKTCWCMDCYAEQSKIYYSIEENKQKTKVRLRNYHQMPEVKRINNVKWHDYRAKKKGLPSTLTLKEVDEVFAIFENKCALSGECENISIEHFIGLHTGRVGNVKENIIPLARHLNLSKHIYNPFEWFKLKGKEHNLSEDKFNKVVEYLASNFNMTGDQFKEFVYECYDGKEKRNYK
ncbi:hypothetical protein AB1283_01075 [Bacillus sp. S13(2024)]|uniref:hypothetical protein n=1 Tax=Bacillus sp. S13(2024) TaxID=3162885 RepID=UPI003D22A469